MHKKEWKIALGLLCGMAVCATGFGGLALRLSPRAAAVAGEAFSLELEDVEEAPAPTDGEEAEA
jgi:hypothetical protein